MLGPCGWSSGREAAAARHELDRIVIPHVLIAQGDDLPEIVGVLLLHRELLRELLHPQPVSDTLRTVLQQLSQSEQVRGAAWLSIALRVQAYLYALLDELGCANPMAELAVNDSLRKLRQEHELTNEAPGVVSGDTTDDTGRLAPDALP